MVFSIALLCCINKSVSVHPFENKVPVIADVSYSGVMRIIIWRSASNAFKHAIQLKLTCLHLISFCN